MAIGFYTRWFHRWVLVAGWAVGMALGTAMAASQNFSAIFSPQVGGFNLAAYAAHYALIANLVVAALELVL